MKTNIKLLVSSLTLAASILVMLVASTTTARAQFFTNPGQSPQQAPMQAQQIQQASQVQSAPAYGSSTTTTVIPLRSILGGVGWSTAHPQDAVASHSQTVSGNGEYSHREVRSCEYANTYIVQDPNTGRRQAFLVQTRTLTTNNTSFTTPVIYPPVQITYAKDAPKYKTVYGPNTGKRWSK